MKRTIPSAAGWGAKSEQPPRHGAPTGGFNGFAPSVDASPAAPVGAFPLAVNPESPEQLHDHIEHLKHCLGLAQSENREFRRVIQELARNLYPRQYQDLHNDQADWSDKAGPEKWEGFFHQARTRRPPQPAVAPSKPAPDAGVTESPDAKVTESSGAGVTESPTRRGADGRGPQELQDDGSMGDVRDMLEVPVARPEAVPLVPTAQEAPLIWTVRQLQQRQRGYELEEKLRVQSSLGHIEETPWGGLIVPGPDWPDPTRHPWNIVRRLWPSSRRTSQMLLNWWAVQPDPSAYRLPADQQEVDCHLWSTHTAGGPLRHGVLFLHGQTEPAAYGTVCMRKFDGGGPASLTCVLPSHAEAAAVKEYLQGVNETKVRVETMPAIRGRDPSRASDTETAFAETYPAPQ